MENHSLDWTTGLEESSNAATCKISKSVLKYNKRTSDLAGTLAGREKLLNPCSNSQLATSAVTLMRRHTEAQFKHLRFIPESKREAAKAHLNAPLEEEGELLAASGECAE